MQRIPEPELMNEAEQALAYAQADFTQPHQYFITRFQETFPAHEVNGRVLDLGCGPADITLRFARAYPDTIIDGVDGAEAMLALGRKAIAAAGQQQRIQLSRCYLPIDAPPQTQYDAIISNSLLHHLQQPQVLWQSVKQYAAPGAPVFIMDLLRPESKAQAQELVQLYAAEEAEILRYDFYHSLLAAYSVEEVRQQLLKAELMQLNIEIASDRHFTVSGLL